MPPLAIWAGVDAGQQQQAGQWRPVRHKDKRAPAPRPTHFLALQVSQHPAAVAAIQQVQSSLVQHSPHLQQACVDAATAHLTLGVMALGGQEQRAVAALAALANVLDRVLLAPVDIELQGLSHFRNQVLYLDVCRDGGLDRLMRLAAATREHFHRGGLLLQADQAFVPHVTIAKTSKLQQGGKHGGRQQWGGGQGGRHAKQPRPDRGRGDEEAGSTADSAEGKSEFQAVDPAAAQGGAAAAPAPVPGPREVAPLPGLGDAAPSSRGGAEQDGAAEAQPEQEQRHERGQQPRWSVIPPEAWAEHAAIAGGRVVPTAIQLCAMQGRRPGQYYSVLSSLPLTPPAAAAADSCAPPVAPVATIAGEAAVPDAAEPRL